MICLKAKAAQRTDHSCTSDTESYDKATHCHLSNTERCSLQDRSNDEQDATDVDGWLAPILVGGEASEDGTKESCARRDGCDKLFFA